MDPNDATTIRFWAEALAGLAEKKNDESLYREAFEKYEKAAQLDQKNVITFSNWGYALAGLAKIKNDESLYREAFEKYEKAAQMDPNDATAFSNWGYSLEGLAEKKNDESLYREAFEKYEKAAQLDPNDAFAIKYWGNALADLAEIKKDESLYREAFEKYAEATQLDPKNAFSILFWGNALADLAKIKKDESLYREAFKKYEKAAQLDQKNVFSILFWGNALADLAKIKEDKSLYQEAFKKYEKAAQLDQNDATAIKFWGNALADLAEIKEDESLYREAFEKCEKAAQLDPKNATAFNNWGNALTDFAGITEDTDLFNRFYLKSDSLKKLKKDILGICIMFSEKNMKEIIKNVEIFFPLLDPELKTDDSSFFEKTTKGITDTEELKKYKKAYILSILIISQLHVNNKNEKSVAYYTNKTTLQKMLLNDNAFRLNAINYSNDPTEGQVLVDYLFERGKYPSKEFNSGYGAFAGCFTFNYDSLNQFRLYGKEGNIEGTGLSLVFKTTFFSREAKMAVKQTTFFGREEKMVVKQENISAEDKLQALFRCIYIDPETRRVETVGRKEKYLFYHEKNDRESDKDTENIINEYNSYITDIIESVEKEMEELKKIVKNLKPEIIGPLLINLRYLTKHIAFKEEQECRIIKIHPMSDTETVKINPDPEPEGNIQIDKIKQMYIEYQKIIGYIEKIYFGPNADQMELFQDLLKYKHKDQDIPCKRSKNPLSKPEFKKQV
jgi:tetratricopeptide (TPR) repeat protein